MNPTSNQSQAEKHVGIHIKLNNSFIKGLALVIVGVLVGGIIAYLYSASRFKSPEPNKTITINSSGSVELKGTEAVISGYLYDYSKKYTTSAEAESAGKIIVDKVKTDLSSLDIPNSNIIVSSYPTPEYKDSGYYPVSTPAPDGQISFPSYPSVTAYYISVSVSVTLKGDLVSKTDQVVKILDTQKLSPSTVMYAIPSDALKSEARKKALLDAKMQIDDLEDIGDLNVGKIISVKDTTAESKQDPYGYDPYGGKIYIEQGSTTAPYTVTLEIVYQLK